MSNFPAGVTGHESAFDVPPDDSICVECDRLFENDLDGKTMCPQCTDMLGEEREF